MLLTTMLFVQEAYDPLKPLSRGEEMPSVEAYPSFDPYAQQEDGNSFNAFTPGGGSGKERKERKHRDRDEKRRKHKVGTSHPFFLNDFLFENTAKVVKCLLTLLLLGRRRRSMAVLISVARRIKRSAKPERYKHNFDSVASKQRLLCTHSFTFSG